MNQFAILYEERFTHPIVDTMLAHRSIDGEPLPACTQS